MLTNKSLLAVLRVGIITLLGGLPCLNAQENGTLTSTDSSGSLANFLEGRSLYKVEEDWLIDVAEPDPEADAPQITMVFGPSSPLQGTHALFEINHATIHSFEEGGMQFQLWWKDWLIGHKRHPNHSELETAIERITFTAKTELLDGKISMEIINGKSVTFESFGGKGYLKLGLSTYRSDLNDYDQRNSIIHSRVTYGANRVNQLCRTEIRYYARDGKVFRDQTDTYVHKLAGADEALSPINSEP